jgi:hypothetical protein
MNIVGRSGRGEPRPYTAWVRGIAARGLKSTLHRRHGGMRHNR